VSNHPASARPLSAQDKALQLRNLPDGATRVQVMDAKKKTCWRKVEEVKGDDTLMFGNDGKPVVMRGEPGRKPKPTLEPASPEAADVMAAKEAHLREDKLIEAVSTDPASEQVLDLLMQQMTLEASSLEFERQKAERHNDDTSSLSVKRARILTSIAEVYLKRREKLAEAAFDLDTPYAEAFVSFLLETVRGTMLDAGMRVEQVESVFAKLGKRLDDGWKLEAKAKMRGAKK
jgi:hypothetical protein